MWAESSRGPFQGTYKGFYRQVYKGSVVRGLFWGSFLKRVPCYFWGLKGVLKLETYPNTSPQPPYEEQLVLQRYCCRLQMFCGSRLRSTRKTFWLDHVSHVDPCMQIWTKGEDSTHSGAEVPCEQQKTKKVDLPHEQTSRSRP